MFCALLQESSGGSSDNGNGSGGDGGEGGGQGKPGKAPRQRARPQREARYEADFIDDSDFARVKRGGARAALGGFFVNKVRTAACGSRHSVGHLCNALHNSAGTWYWSCARVVLCKGVCLCDSKEMLGTVCV